MGKLREPLNELAACGLPCALEAMGERWSFMILRAAFNHVRHFEEFLETLGIARDSRFERMLRAIPRVSRNSSKWRTWLNAARRIMNDQRSPITSSAEGSPQAAISFSGSRNLPIGIPLSRPDYPRNASNRKK